MNQQRQLNIELLRVFSMLLINLWHIPIHFGDTLSQGTVATSSLMTYVTYFIPFHVNLFILITGYFGTGGDKKCIEALLKTLLLVYFYSLTLNVFSQIVLGHFSYHDTFMPISSKTWWFMTMYTVMLLIAPFIERYVADSSRKAIYAIVAGTLFVDLYLGYFHHVGGIYDEGWGMTHFVSMYILGVWIRKEGINLVRQLSWSRTCLTILILCMIVIQYKAIAWMTWSDLALYCAPYSIVMSMLTFLLFANINIPESFRKCIQFFSSSVISVYLITEYPAILEILKSLFASAYPSFSNSVMEVVFISFCIGIAFVIPCLIDKVRIPVTNYTKDKILHFIS